MKSTQFIVLLSFLFVGSLKAQKVDIKGPVGSERFGSNALFLSNGNLVLIDYLYDDAAKKDVGAVYLYNGVTLELISTLKGSSEGDSVGYNGIQSLGSGNFVVKSQFWQNGSKDNAGAVTFVNATTGLNGIVSVSNSVVGASKDDNIGNNVTIAANGNYMIICSSYDNGTVKDVGAVAYCNGATGSAFTIGISNALLGSSENDHIGGNGIYVLSNGNYLVLSPDWDNGADSNAGAITFCSGNSGLIGTVSESNSLIGNHKNDFVGAPFVFYFGSYGVITELQNANYLVYAPFWHNDTASNAGSVTWCSGTTGKSGRITKTNSLVGSQSGDGIGRLNTFGDPGIFSLTAGNYLIISPEWNNGSIKKAGAITWGNGTTGITGEITQSNSLIGSHDSDLVGSSYPTILNNGNIVVCSPLWDRGSIRDVGAATWIDASTGLTGLVGLNNSVVGSQENDNVSNNGCRGLTSGNYVILSPFWNNDTFLQAGAATWCFGGSPTALTINKGNSLVGSYDYDWVGISSTNLNNGNFVINSYQWDDGSIINAGASTWVNGTTGVTGEISRANSVIGTSNNDAVGNNVRALTNSNYILLTSSWDSGSITNAGAATWCNGATGRTGIIGPDNSLVGTRISDNVGQNTVGFTNGNYLVLSRNWDNGAVSNAGAITWCNGTTGRIGEVSKSNSLVGASSGDNLGNTNPSLLASGKYVVRCQFCDNQGILDVGAVVIGNSDGSTVGEIGTSNALMGSTANDNVGTGSTNLSNGNVVIRNQNWDNGAKVNAGAITWMDINNPVTGLVSAANSLVGTNTDEAIGVEGISNANGDYYFRSRNWSSVPGSFEGAITIANGSTGLTGTINSCNSFLGVRPNTGTQLSSLFSNINKYLIILRPMDTMATVFRQNGQSLALHLDAISLGVSGNSAAALITASCRIIALVTPNGNQPVSGKVKGEVWVETTQPDSFVKRHYQITATNNTDSADAKVTLYFTQAEFDEYNAGNAAKLPTSINDLAGKLNLRIEKRGGSSSDKSGMPNTYPGSITSINPEETDVVWNEGLKRWEVSFNTTGFSGFFVKAQATVNAIDDKEKDQYQNSISIFPNPTDGEVYILVSNKANSELEVTNMLGKTVFKKSIKGNGNYKIDLSAHMPGIYLIKFNTGEVYKVIKK